VIYLAAMVLALRLSDQVDAPLDTAVVPPSGPASPAGPATSAASAGSEAPGGTVPYEWAPPGGTVPYEWAPPGGTIPYEAASRPGGTIPYEAGAPFERAALPPGAAGEPAGASGPAAPRKSRWRSLANVGPVVGEAMRGNAVLRAFSGYMVFFLAFLLRTEHFGVSHNFALGALVAAAAAGGLAAMAIGSLVKARAPQAILFAMLTLAPIVTAACAWFFSLEAAIAVVFTAALAAGLAKLSLDSTVQREIGEEIRSSAFAVSETLNQVSNVAGSLVGVFVSILNNGQVGLAIPAAGLTAALVLLITRRRRVLTQRAEEEPAPTARRTRRDRR
jgi:hypothetical protein